MKLYTFLFFLLVLSACGTIKSPYYSDDQGDWQSIKPTEGKKIVHTLYLVGDTGELDDENEKTNFVLEALKKNLSSEKGETSLVFLGDNIYPRGMPSKKSEDRAYAEDIINAQLECARYHDGKTYFIPGNHDWNKHHPKGRKAILRQEEYVQDYFDKNGPDVKFYPNDACGDPKVVKINKDLVFIFLDTQWWLQDWSGEKKMNKGCDIKSRGDLLKTMEEIFYEYKNDEIVIMMHHPVYTDGTHGGRFSWKQHLFPLTEAKDNLFIPLPVIGSLYPAYRQITGSPQDNTNVQNKELIQGINDIAKKLRINVIFATGHDHGLQYFDKNKLQYIVSGAGGKIDYVARGGEADYARSARGYVKIDFYEDFESHAEFYVVDTEEVNDATGFQGTLEYKTILREPRPGTVEEEVKYAPLSSNQKVVAASEDFAAGPLKKLFLGSQYRDMWATPVAAEMIDLETKLGGLTPIKKGGGMASNSLRMSLEDGKHYILRSIKKDYTKLVPPEFSNLKLIDVLADQNSASHPYNALIIPRLSEAAGVYYTTPKLVYLQHQRGLGNYNSQFPEELYLLEERPSGDWSEFEQFGNSDEIIGYVDLLEILREKKNHFIDQKWVLKSRIFDVWIHDWDRHDDQWRWAKFEEDDKHIYRPIPRDRDQAFYRFKGLVPWYIAAFLQKKFKTMKEDVKDVKHQSFNARNFDRFFLNQLTWQDWEEVITQLQRDITHEDIEEAIKLFPKEVLELDFDEELEHLLKARKDNLLKIGKRLYDFQAREVEIVGSDNKDDFLINVLEDGAMEVVVMVDSKDHGTLIKFERTFLPQETEEVRLYGEGGKDHFKITGASSDQIKLRIIGGEAKDEIDNEVHPRLYVYDNLKGVKVEGAYMDRTSDDIDVNEYDREGFRYNSNFPILTFGNSVDDGWWIGGAVSWTDHAWRKDPYLSKHNLSASFAPGSRNAFLISYEGHFPAAIGSLDFKPSASVEFPHYENFFGLGPTSVNDLSRSIQFNWVRMQDVDVYPRMLLPQGSYASFEFGPLYQYRNISINEGRVSTDETLGFNTDELNSRHYLGGKIGYQFDFRDSKLLTTNGFRFGASFSHLREPILGEQVSELSTHMALYYRVANKPLIVLASQIGYEESFGDLQFYQHPDLGNNHGLRGWRNERWRGASAFYHNIDLRMKLFKWDSFIIPMDVGIVGGYDYGRVEFEGEEGAPWRRSYTIGLWLQPLGTIVIQPYYALNEEQNTFSLKLGFNF